MEVIRIQGANNVNKSQTIRIENSFQNLKVVDKTPTAGGLKHCDEVRVTAKIVNPSANTVMVIDNALLSDLYQIATLSGKNSVEHLTHFYASILFGIGGNLILSEDNYLEIKLDNLLENADIEIYQEKAFTNAQKYFDYKTRNISASSNKVLHVLENEMILLKRSTTPEITKKIQGNKSVTLKDIDYTLSEIERYNTNMALYTSELPTPKTPIFCSHLGRKVNSLEMRITQDAEILVLSYKKV